jgi:peroxiredoxin Q/BCP
MKHDFTQFISKNVTIAVVAPHSPLEVAEYWQKEALPMIGIPDEDGRLSALYGQRWKLLKLGRMPAFFIIDREGRLVFSHYGKSMSDIPINRDILKIIDLSR